MGLLPSERAQSTQIGFILLFGILVVCLTIYQAQIIPNQNAEVEFNHNQEVRNDMVALYGEIVSVGASSKTGQTVVTINTGIRYPSRIGINPPPVAGSIESTARGTMYINGSSDGMSEICGSNTTSGIKYNPGYHVTEQASITYENGLLYLDDPGTNHIILEQQPIVDESNQNINIHRLSGAFRNRGSVTSIPVELTGTKTYGEVDLAVNNDTGITLPSELPASVWNDRVLPSGITATQNGSSVDLSGFEGDTYTIRCYSVGIRERPPTEFTHKKSF